jgi:hypothetical protein
MAHRMNTLSLWKSIQHEYLTERLDAASPVKSMKQGMGEENGCR